MELNKQSIKKYDMCTVSKADLEDLYNTLIGNFGVINVTRDCSCYTIGEECITNDMLSIQFDDGEEIYIFAE